MTPAAGDMRVNVRGGIRFIQAAHGRTTCGREKGQPLKRGLTLSWRKERLSQKRLDIVRQTLKILRFALPDDQDLPTESSQRGFVPSVTPCVAVELVLPEVAPLRRLRNPIPRTPLMPVPETTMHEDHLTAGSKHQVGPSREISSVKPIPISQTVDKPSHLHLRLCVPGTDRPHARAPLLDRQRVQTASFHRGCPSASRPKAENSGRSHHPRSPVTPDNLTQLTHERQRRIGHVHVHTPPHEQQPQGSTQLHLTSGLAVRTVPPCEPASADLLRVTAPRWRRLFAVRRLYIHSIRRPNT